MAKVIWKGEDTEDVAGPSFNIWNGIKFPKGVEVEVTDPYMLNKLNKLGDNRFYKVIEETKQENSHGESQTQSKDEGKAEEKSYDYRKTENSSGYSPVKKKVRKKKPAAQKQTNEPTNEPSAAV